MKWNHRIVRFEDKGSDTGYFYQIQEVYYDDKGIPCLCSDTSVGGQDIKECRADLKHITAGTKKPYLRYPEDFIGKSPLSKPKKKGKK